MTKRLKNPQAENFIRAKTNVITQNWNDLTTHEHAIAFTVAKIADEDMLKEVRKAVQKAIDDGKGFGEFKKTLKPYLTEKGWLPDGKAGDRRLRTIFQTNTATAYASARWQRIQAVKDTMPYLQYRPSTSHTKRDDHKAYYGLIRPVDDPIWQSIFPPNGFGCRCSTRQLTQRQAEKLGITADDKLTDLPKPQFDSNFDRLGGLLKLAEEKHGGGFKKNLKNELIKRYPTILGISTLPKPQEWQQVATIGEQIYQKHQAIFDNVDFNKPNDFANAVLEVMILEGVEIGGIVNVVGDSVEQVQEILGRYPKSWVEKANELGKVFVRNMDTRGYQIYLSEQAHLDYFKQLEINEKHTIFQKFAKQMQIGDSLLKLNDMGGKVISNQAYNITIHEFAHRLQFAMPELDEYFAQLWLDRTKGEKTRPLSVIQAERGEIVYYDKSEVGRKDNFADVYVGRNYGTDENPKPKEVMTMTFQQLLGSNMTAFDNGTFVPDTKTYWQNDKELLYLGLALLIRYQP